MDAARLSEAARECMANCLNWNSPRVETALFTRWLVAERGWNALDALDTGRYAMRLMAAAAIDGRSQQLSLEVAGPQWRLLP